MFVDAAVSSMNTSLLGSSLACILNHAFRAAATSGRSCSAACRLFFKCETQMAKKAKDRGLANSHILLRQASSKFRQRDVRPHVQPSPDPIPLPFQRITFVATKLFGIDAPRASPTREKSAYRTDANATEFSGLFIGVARFDRMNYATPQVLRVWLAHSCWPCGGSWHGPIGPSLLAMKGQRSACFLIGPGFCGLDWNDTEGSLYCRQDAARC